MLVAEDYFQHLLENAVRYAAQIVNVSSINGFAVFISGIYCV
jgi:hypothetical protein